MFIKRVSSTDFDVFIGNGWENRLHVKKNGDTFNVKADSSVTVSPKLLRSVEAVMKKYLKM